MDLSSILKGRKTYAAALGLLAMAAFQYYTGDLVGAGQSVLGALTAFGLRSAVADLQLKSPTPTPPSSENVKQ